MKLPDHHQNWLDNHPDRTIEWFKDMLAQGFDVHHIDGDHLNNSPKNLALIEHKDHMRLHNINMNRLKKMPYGYKKTSNINNITKIKGQRYLHSECGNWKMILFKGERPRANIFDEALEKGSPLSIRLIRVQ